MLRTSYNTELVSVIPNYQISPGQIEAALVVPLPARLEVASLRLYYRVEPQEDFSMRAYWSVDSFSDEIDDAVAAISQLIRRELWLREKHPRKMIQELAPQLHELIEQVYDKTENMQQAYVKDISEGGARLIHDRQIKLLPGNVQKLTLLWGDELWEVDAKIIRSGELEPEPHPSRIYTSVQFINMDSQDRQRLSKLMHEMVRKELVQRAAHNDY